MACNVVFIPNGPDHGLVELPPGGPGSFPPMFVLARDQVDAAGPARGFNSACPCCLERLGASADSVYAHAIECGACSQPDAGQHHEYFQISLRGWRKGA